ncbi:GT2 family glycosyltransferase [Aliiruegeria haliotis]|uniref:GT2 family glycosyltransferase n=1 Tax=Aliiruegeria haliotis TaxID=1280846 RepID=A0A2T0RSQ2_9RHOB|nr:glycosyltransferase family A protein [Aliiruegeria haliotis]PRY24229.1 GT2 family glycosyltransferase [Aliiruegeria haliotis]
MAEVQCVGGVVIGRNEGERLERCLASLGNAVESVVYVDSGSSDDSVAIARRLGADVVELDAGTPFTAARARNAGVDRLVELGLPEFVQFVDGDCEILPGWIAKGCEALRADGGLCAVSGRLRERDPQASLYNRLLDAEWDGPVGPVPACGGNALFRCSAVRQVGGFDPNLIAGEEPELCFRLRQSGWAIMRIDAEMTLHDASMTRFSQWWQRSRRAGHAFAEGAAMHGRSGEHFNVRETLRALAWGGLLPFALIALALLLSPWWLLGGLIYPAQGLRISRRVGAIPAVFMTLGRFAEAQGIAGFLWNRRRGTRQSLIEYK